MILKLIDSKINTNTLLSYLVDNINETNVNIIEKLIIVGGNKDILKNKLMNQNTKILKFY